MTNFQLLIVLAAVCWQAQAQVLKVRYGAPWGTWGNVTNCPKGTYAGGMSIRVEGKQGWGDDTALNGIRLYCVRPQDGVYHPGDKYVESNPGYWGLWSDVKSLKWCPAGFVAFKLKVEGAQGSGDDTAVNDIKLMCRDGAERGGEGGPWGRWRKWSAHCGLNTVICGLQTAVEKKQGKKDDTGLNDVRFHCCNPFIF